MLKKPMDVLTAFPVRKSKKQKAAFREAVQAYVTDHGYQCSFEKGGMGAQNIVIGDPKTARYLITAHYDTPARMIIPNLITPCNPVTFVAYQLLVTALLLVPAMLVGILMGILVMSPLVGELVYMVTLIGMLYLMMFGPANPNTANDNTSGVVTVLEILRTLPEMHRDKVCFVLFDLEEAGLVGSAAYRKAHKKETNQQIILNLDCVGDGDEIIFFPTKKLKKDTSAINRLKRIGGWFGDKHISLRDKGFSVYPSDQKNFPLGVGIAAFHKSKFAGPYCSRIHTAKDTILEETNVNLLRAALTTLITDTAAQ